MKQVSSFARPFAALTALLLIVVASQRVSAGSIFLQSPTASPVNGFVSDFGEPRQRADDFSLGAAATVQSISWWGSYFGNPAVPPAANFALRFFADAAGTPQTVPFYNQLLNGATRVDSGLVDVSGNKVYKFTSNLPVTQALLGGTTYYASVVENAAGPAFFWSGDGAGPDWFRLTDADPWANVATNANFAFELFDANGNPPLVPTPTAAAGGIALLGMLIAKRRRHESF